jgi:integrase
LAAGLTVNWGFASGRSGDWPNGDFQYDASFKVWTLRVVGKGNKARDVTVTEELLAELEFYRRNAFNKQAMPEPGEDLPLIHQLNGKGWREPRP